MRSCPFKSLVAVLRFLASIFAVASLVACAPSLEATRYFRHSIIVENGGDRLEFAHFFSCRKEYDLSEADNKMHQRWIMSGNDFITSDIGGGKVLIYRVTGDCQSDHVVNADPQHLSEFVSLYPYADNSLGVLDRSVNPQVLFQLTHAENEIGRLRGDFPIRVVQENIDRVSGAGQRLGATSQEMALKSTIRATQHGFRYVSVSVYSPEVWDTSKAAHDYFGQFTTVAVAKIGDAPPKSGREDTSVGFPFAETRNYGHQPQAAFKRASVTYNGREFVYSDSLPSGPTVWFAIDKTRATEPAFNNHATVNYKGVSFDVVGSQEIFDPATRNILFFYNFSVGTPWSPGSADRQK
jgi:hypothetical protein